MNKTCPQCGVEKTTADFGKSKARKDGLRHVCRECNNAKAKEWHYANPEKAAAGAKRWAENNPGKRKEIFTNWIRDNKDRFRRVQKEYYAAHKDAAMASARAWEERNPQKKRELLRRYKTENRDKVLASAARYRAENKEEIKQRIKKWALRNPAKIRAAWMRRTAAEIQATPKWLTAIQLAQIQELYEISEAKSMQTGIKHHVDHIHPLRGKNFRGLHAPWNLQVLTAAENLAKSNNLQDAQYG